MIKLFFIDLDGTFLDPTGNVTTQSREAIRALHKHNIRVAINTGRSLSHVESLLGEWQVEGLIDLLVCSNGAEIKNCMTNETKIVGYVDNEEVGKVYEIFKDNDELNITTMDDNVYVMEKITPLGIEIGKHDRIEIGQMSFEQMTAKKRLKYIYIGSKEILDVLEEKFRQLHLPINGVRSHFSMFELCNPNISKGKSIHFVCDMLGYHIDETASIGDQSNDIEMLKATQVAIAMGNATDEVKSLCDHVCKDYSEEGFADGAMWLIERCRNG